MPNTLQIDTLLERKLVIEKALAERLPSAEIEPRRVHEAMRYAVLGPGKRLRPIIATGVGDLAGGPIECVLDSACAIEFVHAASLILDDLPSMDNAATRRGRPCTHVTYGEATAVLGAMGLIALGFDLVARNAESSGLADSSSAAVRFLAKAIGTNGIICGQHVDLASTAAHASIQQLEEMYHQKAGTLFQAAAVVPAFILRLPDDAVTALRAYSLNMGVALQVTDDLLDAEVPHEDAGKTTFSTHLGTEGAKDKVCEAVDHAIAALEIFGERAETLRLVARLLLLRLT
jgi:geranylgeranyl pyrophosphate synthase